MIDKDPLSYPLITYVWIILISCWGGAVNFIRKVQSGKARVFNVTEFVGEIATSGFAGVITFWLCEASKFPPLMSAALVGISGHMGSRAIFLLENWLTRKFRVGE